jgi:uncharacterized membrane protein (UPF0127 family)
VQVSLLTLFCLIFPFLNPLFGIKAFIPEKARPHPKPCQRVYNLSSLDIQVATQSSDLIWGLMGRRKLKANEGMLFDHGAYTLPSIWAFNTFVLLDVAFIDVKNQISKIETLPIYPEYMRKLRKINSLNDLKKVPNNNPIRRFFSDHSLKANHPCRYILEMPQGWFKKNLIEEGDTLHWELSHDLTQAKIEHLVLVKKPFFQKRKINKPLNL